MGLGKTSITLSAISTLINRFEVMKVLIIAPLRVADRTWTDEIAKWDHLSGLTTSKILGNQSERLKALYSDADIYLINRENVPWLIDQMDVSVGDGWLFDMVVIDELSSFKSPSSNRFKKLRKFINRADRVVGLTGTPAPNGLIDLWSQIYLIDGGERLGKTVTSYRNTYFTPGKRNGAVVFNYVARDGCESIIHNNLSDICLSMAAVDHLDMPDLVDVQVDVALSERELSRYKEFEKEKYLEFANGSEITAITAGVLINKLLQYSNGAVYGEEGNYTVVSDAKLDALEDIVESANGKPVLVFYCYKHDRERIMARIKCAAELDIDKWCAGEQIVALAHPASAGHGLNLQSGGNHIVWYGLTWSLELYQQANARLWRQGQQSQHVTVHHLITSGTQDTRVLASIRGKSDVQSDLIAALKKQYKC